MVATCMTFLFKGQIHTGADTGFMLTVAPYKIITLCACAVTRLSEIINVLSQWFLMSFPRRIVLATELRLQKLKH